MGNSLYCTQNGSVAESSAPNTLDQEAKAAEDKEKTAASSPDKTLLQSASKRKEVKVHNSKSQRPVKETNHFQQKSSNAVIVNKILSNKEERFSEEQINTLKKFGSSPDVNLKITKSQNLLLWYLENTRAIDNKTLDLILKSGVDVKQTDTSNQNALHYAINNPTIPDNYSKILITAGVDFQKVDNKGYNPLMCYVKSNRVLTYDLVSQLSSGMSIDRNNHASRQKAQAVMNQTENEMGFNTLMLYLNNHQRLIQSEMVQFLRSSGASLNYVTSSGHTALKVYLANKHQLKVLIGSMPSQLVAVQRGLQVNIDGIGSILHASEVDFVQASEIFRVLRDKASVQKIEEERIRLLELHFLYGKPIEYKRCLEYLKEAKSLKELLNLLQHPEDVFLQEFRLMFIQAEQEGTIRQNAQLMQMIDTRFTLKKMWLRNRDHVKEEFVQDSLLILKLMQFRKRIKRCSDHKFGHFHQGIFIDIAKYS